MECVEFDFLHVEDSPRIMMSAHEAGFSFHLSLPARYPLCIGMAYLTSSELLGRLPKTTPPSTVSNALVRHEEGRKASDSEHRSVQATEDSVSHFEK